MPAHHGVRTIPGTVTATAAASRWWLGYYFRVVDYPPQGIPPHHYPVSASRLLAVCVVGVVAGTVAAFFLPWQAALLVGWDTAAVSWMVAVWAETLHFDALETSQHATREDPNRAVSDGLLLAASAASLIAIALVTVKAGRTHGVEKGVLLAVSIVSVFVSWTLVHTLFTLRYAALYYTGPDGGIDFNEDVKPRYTDFAYVSFTIGMTFQVSDTNLTDSTVRRTALRHALLSYLFGAVILATIINLVAGLVR